MPSVVLEGEFWLDIPGSPKFQASNYGRVRADRRTSTNRWSSKRPVLVAVRILKKDSSTSGTSIHLGKKTLSRANAVCSAFWGIRPEWAEGVLHIDGNKLNDRPSNLKWATRSEIIKQACEASLDGQVRRFWNHVAVSESRNCWEWLGGKFTDGYGSFKISKPLRKSVRAHRYALSLKLGREVAPDKLACHKCDNISCVNPAHLYEGSPRQNSLDCSNRLRRPLGGSHGGSKLSEEEVIEMRERRSIGETLENLAHFYKVGSSTVQRITAGESWRHAPGPIK